MATIIGTPGSDIIQGFTTNDVISADAGDDTITDLGGSNNIDGGDGNDSISTGTGADIIKGGLGDDVIFDLGGDNDIDGGDGNDSITTGSGADIIRGGLGDDGIASGGGNDIVFGGDGFDTITTGNGNDRAYGQAGIDFIDGEAGNDLLFGDAGDDQITGGAGSDFLSGGEGNDIVQTHNAPFSSTSNEKDELYGGVGTDTFKIRSDYDANTKDPSAKRDTSFAIIRDFNLGETDKVTVIKPLTSYIIEQGDLNGDGLLNDTFIISKTLTPTGNVNNLVAIIENANSGALLAGGAITQG